MDFNLEQVLASAVRYIQERTEKGTALYFDEIPESFYVPSVYFPVPRTQSQKVTLNTYLTTIYFEAWFMASENWIAAEAAAMVRDDILLGDCGIDSVSKDGTFDKKKFRVTDVETIPLEKGIVKLQFEIQHYFSREEIETVCNKKIRISFSAKSSPVYEAWKNATGEFRKEGGL